MLLSGVKKPQWVAEGTGALGRGTPTLQSSGAPALVTVQPEDQLKEQGSVSGISLVALQGCTAQPALSVLGGTP